MSCNHLCRQGRSCDCAVINFAAESEGVMPMATACTVKAAPGTHYCDKTRQPCVMPYTCTTACKLITANSDGSTAHALQTSTRPTLKWFGVLIIFSALAAYATWQSGLNF